MNLIGRAREEARRQAQQTAGRIHADLMARLLMRGGRAASMLSTSVVHEVIRELLAVGAIRASQHDLLVEVADNMEALISENLVMAKEIDQLLADKRELNVELDRARATLELATCNDVPVDRVLADTQPPPDSAEECTSSDRDSDPTILDVEEAPIDDSSDDWFSR